MWPSTERIVSNQTYRTHRTCPHFLLTKFHRRNLILFWFWLVSGLENEALRNASTNVRPGRTWLLAGNATAAESLRASTWCTATASPSTTGWRTCRWWPPTAAWRRRRRRPRPRRRAAPRPSRSTTASAMPRPRPIRTSIRTTTRSSTSASTKSMTRWSASFYQFFSVLLCVCLFRLSFSAYEFWSVTRKCRIMNLEFTWLLLQQASETRSKSGCFTGSPAKKEFCPGFFKSQQTRSLVSLSWEIIGTWLEITNLEIWAFLFFLLHGSSSSNAKMEVPNESIRCTGPLSNSYPPIPLKR